MLLRSGFLKYTNKASIRSLNSIRLVHDDIETKFEGDDDKPKKKYQFIKKQHLDGYVNGPAISSSAKQGAYEQAKRLSSFFKMVGLTSAIIVGGAGLYALYTKKEDIANWIREKRGIDDATEVKIPEAKDFNGKVVHLNRKLYNVTNPNASDVPGLYISGNNKYGLVNGDSNEAYQLVLKRNDAFDGKIARYVRLGEKSGVFIDDKGDLYQWGEGFGGDMKKPSLSGQNLVKACISRETIYALTSSGEVLYMPESVEGQQLFSKNEKGWFGSHKIKFKKLPSKKPVQDIQTGKEHIVVLTKDGDVFTSATGFGDRPIQVSWGQFGLPDFSQFDKPPKNNELHDVTLLNKYIDDGSVKKRKTVQIAAGDYFTMCRDSGGRVWEFGRNTYGSIGRQMEYNTEVISYPSPVKLISKHFKRDELPQCVNIAAGGETAYATYTSSNMYHLFHNSLKEGGVFNMDEISHNKETKLLHFSWGHGLKGELGSGRFIHGQYEPGKVKNLNGMKEYNEDTQKVEDIEVAHWAIGGNHVAATLSNGDVYMWGDNEYGQLGNGKRSRSPEPLPSPSLLEPEVNDHKTKTKTEMINDRLQLQSTDRYQQVVIAGPDTTAIYYKTK